MENQNLESQNPSPMETSQKGNGALIGSIIIVAILIIGGIYIFSSTQKGEDQNMAPEQQLETTSEEAVQGSDIQLSSSDELSDIEADLNSTSNMELDSELE